MITIDDQTHNKIAMAARPLRGRLLPRFSEKTRVLIRKGHCLRKGQLQLHF
jgi:hypothetical protein